MELSASEQRLLDFSRERFGEHLSQFLLAGLGEEDEARVWLFTATFTDGQGIDRCREIKVEANERPDIVTLLPRHREPLVILALLRLLIVDREMATSSLSYELEEVLNLLGWEDSAQSRFTIDGAIERYFNLSYDWSLSGEELEERNLSFYNGQSHLVSGYSHYDAEEERRSGRSPSMVEFSAPFVGKLVSRKLFDLDWNTVHGKIFSRPLRTNPVTSFE